MLGCLRTAAAQTSNVPEFRVSEQGDEVVDIKAKLAWRRCAEGMVWTGETCAGTARLFEHSQAVAHVSALFKATGERWRLPLVPELKRLLKPGLPPPLIDPVLFPSTPPVAHWTASSSVAGTTAFNPYNYDNIAQGRSSASVNQVAFLHGWAVDFGSGQVKGQVPKRTPMVLRLVRGAP